MALAIPTPELAGVTRVGRLVTVLSSYVTTIAQVMVLALRERVLVWMGTAATTAASFHV